MSIEAERPVEVMSDMQDRSQGKDTAISNRNSCMRLNILDDVSEAWMAPGVIDSDKPTSSFKISCSDNRRRCRKVNISSNPPKSIPSKFNPSKSTTLYPSNAIFTEFKMASRIILMFAGVPLGIKTLRK